MLDKSDLKQISLIVKNEITDLKIEMNQRFEEQDKRIDQKFKEQDKRIDQKFKEQDKIIAKQISDQMLVFEEHYGKALTIAVEGLNHRNSNIDVQSCKLDNLEKVCNLNSAYAYDHEKRIHNLEIAK